MKQDRDTTCANTLKREEFLDDFKPVSNEPNDSASANIEKINKFPDKDIPLEGRRTFSTGFQRVEKVSDMFTSDNSRGERAESCDDCDDRSGYFNEDGNYYDDLDYYEYRDMEDYYEYRNMDDDELLPY